MRVFVGLLLIAGVICAWHFWNLPGGVAVLLGIVGVGCIAKQWDL